jgi:hypothetical protein
MKRELFSAAALLLAAGIAHASNPAPCLEETSQNSTTCKFSITLPEGDMEYVANYSIGTPNSAVTRAIMVVHGVQRTPWESFNAMLDAAKLEQQENNSIIVAPYFKKLEDTPAANELYWGTGWVSGYNSENGSPPTSSFKVMDEMIGKLLDRSLYPNLQEIVVVGHSAGGQFTQRYAAGTRIDRTQDDLGYRADYAFRYVATNPGTYMYLDNKRPYPQYTVSNVFTVPTEVPPESDTDDKNCVVLAAGESYLDYDEYKYGLTDRNDAPYMNQKSASKIRSDYAGRDVTYLIGTADNDRRHQYLTTDCEADLQGYDRLQRALNFFNHIQQAIPGNQHKLSKVLNVWHSSDDMYGSIPGRAAVFGAHADADSDGFIDTADNCPQLANDQLDSDNDGVGDACDSTPEIIDGDSIPAMRDNCPFVANEDQLDSNNDGIGDACSTQGDLQIRRELIVDFDPEDGTDTDKIYKSEYCFNIYVKNTSATKKYVGSDYTSEGWKVTFPIWGQIPTNTNDYWNANYTQQGPMVTAEGRYSIKPGQEKNVGLCVQGLDSDEDSIYWPADNCPNKANFDQLDSDRDGIGNACDPN